MPEMIFLKDMYNKYDVFDLKSVLEKILYGKTIDICTYTEKRKISEHDPYGEEQWSDSLSLDDVDNIKIIYEKIKVLGTLVFTPLDLIAIRVSNKNFEENLKLFIDDLIIIHEDDVKENFFMKRCSNFLTEEAKIKWRSKGKTIEVEEVEELTTNTKFKIGDRVSVNAKETLFWHPKGKITEESKIPYKSEGEWKEDISITKQRLFTITDVMIFKNGDFVLELIKIYSRWPWYMASCFELEVRK